MVNDEASIASDSSDAALILAVSHSGIGVWDRDIPSGRIVYSRAWKAMLGYDEHEVSDRIEESYTRVHPADLLGVQATIRAHFDQVSDNYAVEHRLRCKDGSYIWVLSRGRVVSRDAHGKPLRMSGVTTDITDTVALSDKLRRSAELLTHLTDEVPGLVYQYREDADGVASFPYASAGIEAIFGTTATLAALNASVVECVIHPDDLHAYRDSLAASGAALERWHMQFRVLLPDVGERWREGEARPRRLDDGSTVWHGFISDITVHKQLELKLHDAAATDFLTGLPNRRQIMARMEKELARVQRDGSALAAVLMFDLDLFKEINDRHGHARGDDVLRHFSQVLLHELRKVDSVGRIGGEEFAIILSGADMADAFGFAERVRARLADFPLRDGALCIDVTVSIGISVMAREDAAITASLSRADEALYQAKQAGRNCARIAAHGMHIKASG
ncbi:sensor domain-containing diguanylate cyclase [Massilia sp. TSP1-1-2]|uniref:sensor domain-containing diguanylate cyclase n=1 Tax=Massilia sp. TSP1-1-2 TaxID=2804649 RepID=UPI003CFB8BB1